MTIHQDLERCIRDTESLVNRRAATRLKPWIHYDNDQLVRAIQNSIRVKDNQANGFLIASQEGISMEQIVLNYPDIFNVEDCRIAKQILGKYAK